MKYNNYKLGRMYVNSSGSLTEAERMAYPGLRLWALLLVASIIVGGIAMEREKEQQQNALHHR